MALFTSGYNEDYEYEFVYPIHDYGYKLLTSKQEDSLDVTFFVVIHQFGFFSMMMDAEGKQLLSDHSSAFYGHVKAVYDQCSGSFHTFKHGAFHGALLGIFTILPIIATGAMFERKGFKYIAINAGYWILCLTIMGAIVCHFMPTSGVYPVKGF